MSDENEVALLSNIVKEKEKQLQEAIEAGEPFLEVEACRKEICDLIKKLNNSYVLVDNKISPQLSVQEIRKRRAFHAAYRDPKNFDEDNFSRDSETSNLFTPQRLHTNNPNENKILNFDGAITSTPTVDSKDIKIKQSPINKTRVDEIKEEIFKELDEDTFTKYFQVEENLKNFNVTINQEIGFREIIEQVKNNIFEYFNPKSELPEDTHYSSAIDNNFSVRDSDPPSGESSSDEEMANKLQMKGLSLKDALDLIPRFNGENIPVSQFLDGCEEAVSIVPEEFHSELAKLIRMRLYGDALNAARAEKFEDMKKVAEFFEKTFGSAKTYFDLTGELAKVRQKSNESVIVYANRLKEIENEIIKAARREGRIKDEAVFKDEFERDCLKFFVKGLRWEIKARMGESKTYKEAQDIAIDTEREYACSMTSQGQASDSKEESKGKIKDVRRVNFLSPVRPQVNCSYCKKTGHGAINCFALARTYSTPDQGQNSRGTYDRFRNFQQQPNMTFGGWNAENRRRTEFLPEQRGLNLTKDFKNRSNNFLRNDNTNLGGRTNYFNSRKDNPYFNNTNNTPNNRDLVCFFCNKKGHMKRDCFKFKAEMEKGNSMQGNAPTLPPAGTERGQVVTAPANTKANEIWKVETLEL